MSGHPTDPQAAFSELARLELGKETLPSVLQRVADLAKSVIAGVDEASVTVVTRDRPSTVAFTGPLALSLDEAQYDSGYGPCLDAAEGGEVLEIEDLHDETRWPDYVAKARPQGLRSSLSIPVPVQVQSTAAINLYGLEPGAFDDEARALGRVLASYAAVAIANTQLHESTRELATQLQHAMDSRAVIEQAKGILMGQRRCGSDEAFGILTDLSQRSNRKLRAVAQALVDDASAAQ